MPRRNPTWKPGSAGGTLITATALENIELGIEQADVLNPGSPAAIELARLFSGVPQLGADGKLAATTFPTYLSEAEIAATARRVGNESFVPHIKAESYGTAAEIEADAGIVINRALVPARAFGLPVALEAKEYRIRTMINVGSAGSHLMGAGQGKTKLKVYDQAAMMNAVIGHYSNASNVRLHDFTVEGTIVDDVTAPRRSRTQTSNGFHTAIKMQGDLAPGVATVVKDVVIERVDVIGAASLPIWFNGVRGVSRLDTSHMELTMDAGWTWCERVYCTNNTSIKSADNGFSISRGCLSVVAMGNTVEMAAYWGVWIAGFKDTGAATDAGPRDFVVFGSTIKNVGKGGICADDAPRHGTISVNTVDGVRRGPIDEPTNIAGVGILIGGFPNDNRTTPSIWAEDINVSVNTLIDCARGGIQYVGARNIDIKVNTIIRPGSQFMADGVTPVSSTAIDQNFGISTLDGAQSTSRNITITTNTIIDDRTTPYMNYPWYATGVTGAWVVDNRQLGARQAAALIDDNRASVTHSGTHIFQGNAKFPGGATAGANAAGPTVAGWAINGLKGSARLLNEILTAGVRRWTIRGSGDDETGGNVGTQIVFTAYDDSGVSMWDVLKMRRETGTIQIRAVPTASLPTAAAAGQGAFIIDTTRGVMLWSDGGVWKNVGTGAAVT
jgi:hypothetical protein